MNEHEAIGAKILDAYENIMSSVPDKCSRCVKPRSYALREANKIADENYDISEAKAKLSENLRWKCAGEVVMSLSCMNNQNYCQFNPAREIPTDPRLLAMPD